MTLPALLAAVTHLVPQPFGAKRPSCAHWTYGQPIPARVLIMFHVVKALKNRLEIDASFVDQLLTIKNPYSVAMRLMLIVFNNRDFSAQS